MPLPGDGNLRTYPIVISAPPQARKKTAPATNWRLVIRWLYLRLFGSAALLASLWHTLQSMRGLPLLEAVMTGILMFLSAAFLSLALVIGAYVLALAIWDEMFERQE